MLRNSVTAKHRYSLNTRATGVMEIHPGEPKHATFWARYFLERLWIACTKAFTAELMDVSRLNKKKVEELLYLVVFVWK